MSENYDFEQISSTTNELDNISYNHKLIVNKLKTQTKIITNTTEQLISAYKLYGLEENLDV